MTTTQKLAAEFVGTLWLVLSGCGSAVLTVAYPWLNIGYVGVSLAFGLSLLTMAYAVGRISGGHFNPAVTIGLTVGGSFEARLIVPYILAQVGGGLAGAGLLYLILSGKPDFMPGSLAAAVNGYGEHSPGGFSLTAALVSEVVFTFIFLLVILGATHKKAPRELAGIAIGMCLTLIHLVSIPITNTSVNPARSTSLALLVGGWALEQLWLFWLAPVAGAALAGVFYRTVIDNSAQDPN